MAESRRCPQCGAELPADASEGICPQCLLVHGLETVPPTSDEAVPQEESRAGHDAVPPGNDSYRGPFTAPTPEELVKHFPLSSKLEAAGQIAGESS